MGAPKEPDRSSMLQYPSVHALYADADVVADAYAGNDGLDAFDCYYYYDFGEYAFYYYSVLEFTCALQ